MYVAFLSALFKKAPQLHQIIKGTPTTSAWIYQSVWPDPSNPTHLVINDVINEDANPAGKRIRTTGGGSTRRRRNTTQKQQQQQQ